MGIIHGETVEETERMMGDDYLITMTLFLFSNSFILVKSLIDARRFGLKEINTN